MANAAKVSWHAVGQAGQLSDFWVHGGISGCVLCSQPTTGTGAMSSDGGVSAAAPHELPWLRPPDENLLIAEVIAEVVAEVIAVDAERDSAAGRRRTRTRSGSHNCTMRPPHAGAQRG